MAFKYILTHARNKLKIALPIFLAAAIVLFLPLKYAMQIGLDRFRSEYEAFLGFLLIFSSVVLLTNAVWWFARLLRPQIKDWLYIRSHRKGFEGMTLAEKEFLRPFIIDGKAEVAADYTSGVVHMLEKKGIILRPSDISIRMTLFNYILQPWAREYLNENSHLLD